MSSHVIPNPVIPAGDLSVSTRVEKWGLYLHIPFCPYICHYCDFVKSAYFEEAFRQKYLRWLESHLDYWLLYYRKEAPNKPLTSVNFGGGTPSIYGEELAVIFTKLAPYIDQNTEISLEANPEHLIPEKLAAWKSLGINRLSVGVQSFSPQGLSFLKRRHDSDKTKEALRLAKSYFPNLNIDLIYAWPGQTLAMWQEDLEAAIALDASHLSLYNLTYEKTTPIGKAVHRGKIKPAEDSLQADFYELARSFLSKHNFEHEEVSNWAKKGYSCHHNWLYWTDHYYIGIGSGAHGYLPDATIGLRYAYPSSIGQIDELKVDPKKLPYEQSFLIHDARDKKAWLLEILLSGLRTEEGVDLAHIRTKTALILKPDSNLQSYLDRGHVKIANDRLILEPKEWFRENFWILMIEPLFISV